MKTAETVLLGHPDKMCDLIADALLDEYLFHDPDSRVAIEIQGGHGILSITGEVTSKQDIDYVKAIRRVFEDVGYDFSEIKGIHWNVAKQSEEIAQGVDRGGAGDSGIVTGYATAETPEMLPREIVLANRIAQSLNDPSLRGRYGPDGKVQVSIEHQEEQISIIVVSIQHSVSLPETAQGIRDIIHEILQSEISGKTRILINPAGEFRIGGFEADSGATGRKIVQDNYGPRVRIGGGAFSGKDATKVDRSGAYWAREVAKMVVEGGEEEAYVEFVWAIGEPLPIWTNVIDLYALSVQDIIEKLKLKEPKFYERTKIGHFHEDRT